MNIVHGVIQKIKKKPGLIALGVGGLVVAGGGTAIMVERMTHHHQRCNLKVPLPKEIQILPTVSSLHFALNELGVYRRISPKNFKFWGIILQRLDELEAIRCSALRTQYSTMTTLQRVMRKRDEVNVAAHEFAEEIENRSNEISLDQRAGSREAIESACEALVLHAKTCVDTVEFFAQRCIRPRI